MGTGTHTYIKILGDTSKEAILELHADNNAAGDRWRVVSGNSARLDFRNNGANKVSFQGNGKVGIGTTSPSETLGVAGNIKLESGGQRNIIGPLNSNLGIFANPNGTDEGILFSTDDGVTTEMILLNGGNVGIGTVSPTEKFHVVGNSIITGSLGRS